MGKTRFSLFVWEEVDAEKKLQKEIEKLITKMIRDFFL